MPNGVDLDLFGQEPDGRAVRAELGLGDNPVIMFVGSFEPWHGIDLLVEAFALVRERLPEAQLVLVGDGPARSAVEKLSKAKGLSAALFITGFVPHTKVPDYLAAADAASLPYPHLPRELWFSPLKLYEYMAAGKAITASRAGQIAEVIRDGENGLLVEPGSVEDLARALLAILENPELQRSLGENARQQAVERHSWQQYIRRLEQIYYSVLEEHRNAPAHLRRGGEIS
jgi:glycosyltransferase involved in cell wall biosynthesis